LQRKTFKSPLLADHYPEVEVSGVGGTTTVKLQFPEIRKIAGAGY
jgi:hypothetical protein